MYKIVGFLYFLVFFFGQFFFLIRWISFLTFSITVSVYYIHILNDTFVDKYVVNGTLKSDKLASLGQNFVKDVIYYCSKNINISRQKFANVWKCCLYIRNIYMVSQ